MELQKYYFVYHSKLIRENITQAQKVVSSVFSIHPIVPDVEFSVNRISSGKGYLRSYFLEQIRKFEIDCAQIRSPAAQFSGGRKRSSELESNPHLRSSRNA